MSTSVDFLRWFDPTGAHNLVAIEPNTRAICGVTIPPGEWPKAEAFVERWNGKRNLYFSVNEPRPNAPDDKLKEADIAAIRAVYADVDPKPGDLDAARQEIRNRAKAALSSAKPSLVVDSGGGLQFFWTVDKTPVDEAVKRTAKRQGRGIAHLMDGDGVCNIDRIMRLPGTVNLPDKAKLAKGRRIATATILDQRDERYRLDDLARFYKPLDAEEGEDKDGEIAQLQQAMQSWRPEFSCLDEAPDTLRARFADAMATDEGLARLWTGERAPDDTSNSGWRFALAEALKSIGGFGPEDFASVLYCWARHDPEKITPRAIARDWVRADDGGRGLIGDLTDGKPETGAPVTAPVLPPIKWTRPSEWAGVVPKEREWEVEHWIPRYEVCLLYGDGGIGKTLVIHQYATCAAAGKNWLGQLTRQARVMCFFCEDSEDELLRRQIDINRAVGVSFDDIDERLRIASRKYMDNLLALWDRNTGAMKRQAVWERLKADAIAFGAEVVIVDTIADTYGGNEIDRAQVNAFVKSCLGRLAQAIGGTVIALGHPSMSGKQSGSGTSGSTAWSNAVRSRMYLRYPKGVDKGNVRELEGMKLNYGPKGALLKLRWEGGAFELIAANMSNSARQLMDEKRTAGVSIDDAVRDAVIAAVRMCEGVVMSMKPNSPHFAPKVLRSRQGGMLEAFSPDEVETALRRLDQVGELIAVEVGRTASRHPLYGFMVRDKLSDDMGIFS